MAATKFTRNKDYSTDEDNGAGGRSTVDTAGLDGEMDEIVTAVDDHADKLDLLLRDDLLLLDDLLQGHEFSAAALVILAAQLGATGALIWQGDWTTTTAYTEGELVNEAASGNCYICLIAHTSGTFATDLGAGSWELFAAAGSAGLPAQATHANKVLVTDGSSLSWLLVGTANQTGLAPLASPALTGVASVVGVKSGKINKATGANITLDFNAGPNQIVSPLSNNTTVATSNRAAASGETKFIDLLISADGSGPYTFTWPAWRWITDAPATIAASKVGFLSLRCYGAAETDVVAAYAVES